jgi:two-component system NtrC family sensor kinase
LFLRVIGTSRFEPAARAVSEAFEGARPESALDEGLVAWLSLTRKPLCVDDVALRGTGGTSLRGALAALEALGVTLVVPLSIDGELAAILLLGEKVSGEVFQPAEIALLETLMAQTGIALRNSMLYADLQGRMNEIAATQQQLVQSTKLAAIGELAASVAHEINNPLGVILGHADLLARQFAPETKTGKQIAAIQTQGRRAAKIMSDLLNFSRRRDPRREPVALNQLALRASDLLGAKLKKNGVGVETDFDLAAPAVSVDADQITQVLLNVMANACDAQPSGGRLLLRTRFVADVQAVAIDVVDRGVGMTPEQVAQIFEPFYTTKGEQGTGLGLSVSLGIVRNHGGRFEVDSRPGEGTTMTVQLPVNHVPGREVDAAAVKAVAPGTKLLS